ncbi:hypothetical protein GCM10020331_037140 [Ectobacillus funiculus]
MGEAFFPVPNYDINKYPECRKYVEMGFHNAQFNFRLDDTKIGEIFFKGRLQAEMEECYR